MGKFTWGTIACGQYICRMHSVLILVLKLKRQSEEVKACLCNQNVKSRNSKVKKYQMHIIDLDNVPMVACTNAECPPLQLLITIYVISRVLFKDDLLFAYHAMPSWSIWLVPISWSPSPSSYIIMNVSLSIFNNETTSRRRETARRYWYIYHKCSKFT